MKLYLRTTPHSGSPTPLKIKINNDDGSSIIWRLTMGGVAATSWEIMRDCSVTKNTYRLRKLKPTEKRYSDDTKQNPFYVDYQLDVSDEQISRLKLELSSFAKQLIQANQAATMETCTTMLWDIFHKAGIIKKPSSLTRYLLTPAPIDFLCLPDIKTKIIHINKHTTSNNGEYIKRTYAENSAVYSQFIALELYMLYDTYQKDSVINSTRTPSVSEIAITQGIGLAIFFTFKFFAYKIHQQTCAENSPIVRTLADTADLSNVDHFNPLNITLLLRGLAKLISHQMDNALQDFETPILLTGTAYFAFNLINHLQFFYQMNQKTERITFTR